MSGDCDKAATTKVFFTPLPEASTAEQMAAAAERLWERMGLDGLIDADGLVALKQHFGEQGSEHYIPAPVARAIGAKVAAAGGKPFSTDSNTLYNGMRANAVDHLNLACEHGFSHETLGFPVIIADGLKGESQVTLDGAGQTLSHVFLATAGYLADTVVVLTHVTGHLAAGMGASIKNVAMGFAGRAGKLQQHHDAEPIFSADACVACGLCAKHCPADAITIGKTAILDAERCIGCGECYAFCPHGAVSFDWDTTSVDLQKKMADYCLAFHRAKEGRIVYINFITRVTPNCDCVGKSETPLPDIGVVAGFDPVAVDTAAVDLLDQQHGHDVFGRLWPHCSHRTQLEYGQTIGLGSMDYELLTLT